MEETNSNDIVELLRMRACPPEGEYVESDHGHSDCYLEREAADEIERLRALITAWADIQDEIDDLWTSRSPDDFEYTLPDLEKEEREACEALRKAVGR